jgi:hypothetical protein
MQRARKSRGGGGFGQVPDSYFDTASFKDFNFVVREKPIGTRHHTKAKTSINISSH